MEYQLPTLVVDGLQLACGVIFRQCTLPHKSELYLRCLEDSANRSLLGPARYSVVGKESELASLGNNAVSCKEHEGPRYSPAVKPCAKLGLDSRVMFVLS
jgi:hypothetical protein